MRILPILSLIAAACLFSNYALAAQEIECTAKLQNKKDGAGQEAKLVGGTSPTGIFSANITLGECYFQAQSLYPDKLLQIHIREISKSDGISNYSGYDPKGYIISSMFKNDGDLICMLVCKK